MAQTVIYICDICRSTINQEEIFSIQISNLRKLSTGVTHNKLLYKPNALDREICTSCVEELIDKLHLDLKREEISVEVFKDFELPKRITVDDTTTDQKDPSSIYDCNHSWRMLDDVYNECELCGSRRIIS